MRQVTVITDWKRYNTCQKKNTYYIRDVAIRAADSSKERTKEQIEAYHCEYCGNYHIGHRKQNGQTS